MKNSIFKNTSLISLLTFISRCLGLIRDALISWTFGASWQSDAFFIAFRPFDFIRKILSEGILGIFFVPLFSKAQKDKSFFRLTSMFFSFCSVLSLIGIVFIVLSLFVGPFIIKILAPEYIQYSYKYALTIILFKTMLLYLWFSLIAAISMALLNSLDKFALSSFMPIVFNLIIIFCIFFLAKYCDPPIVAIAIGVSLGGLIQCVILIVFMNKLGILKFKGLNFSLIFDLKIFKTIFKMIPSIIGASSFSINVLIVSVFALNLKEGSVSFIYYAERLVQFPLAILSMALSIVLLPFFSKLAISNDLDQIANRSEDSIRLVLFLIFPSIAGLIVLDEQIITILFGYKAFDSFAIKQTANCLFFLSLGLWAFAGTRVLIVLYYSLSCIRIPFYASMLSICSNICLCYLFVNISFFKAFGAFGLVFLVSIAGSFNFIYLFVNTQTIIDINKHLIIVSACRSFFLSAIMYFVVNKIKIFVKGVKFLKN